MHVIHGRVGLWMDGIMMTDVVRFGAITTEQFLDLSRIIDGQLWQRFVAERRLCALIAVDASCG